MNNFTKEEIEEAERIIFPPLPELDEKDHEIAVLVAEIIFRYIFLYFFKDS